MKIQQLEYVIAIAHAGSITAAARNLFQAQPNISIALKELEAEIGMQIFWRTPNGMVLTPEGENFLLRAKDIVESMHSLENDYTNRGEDGVAFKISAVRSAYVSISLGMWVRALDPDEKVSIHLFETNTNKVIDDVTTGKADIGVIRLPVSQRRTYSKELDGSKMAAYPLCEYHLTPLMDISHPLASLDVIPLEELKKYPEIVHADDEMNVFGRTYVNSAYENSDADKRIYVYDNGSKMTLLNFIPGAYMWGTPSPQNTPKGRGALIAKPCSGANIRVMDMVICKKTSENSRTIKSYMDFLREFTAEMPGAEKVSAEDV